jgi:hypothetical protein
VEGGDFDGSDADAAVAEEAVVKDDGGGHVGGL